MEKIFNDMFSRKGKNNYRNDTNKGKQPNKVTFCIDVSFITNIKVIWYESHNPLAAMKFNSSHFEIEIPVPEQLNSLRFKAMISNEKPYNSKHTKFMLLSIRKENEILKQLEYSIDYKGHNAKWVQLNYQPGTITNSATK